jgi:hypothetical protein
MAKKNRNDDSTVVNIASPGSVVGIQCGGDVAGSTVVVNGTTVTSANEGGRWVDIDDMDRSMISDLD